jgi:hypothetical protein
VNEIVNGRQLHEKLNIKEKHAVSIIGGYVDKNIFDESQKKYEFFLNHLLKYVRSSDSCLITDCSEHGNYNNDIINLSESIGKKILDSPFYDSKENKKVKLIGVRSIKDLKEDFIKYNYEEECDKVDRDEEEMKRRCDKGYNKYEDRNNIIKKMTEEQAEEAILSNKRDKLKWKELPGDTMLPRFHTDFIFTNTEEEAQKLRFKFEIKFDFVTYVLINLNREAEFKYLDKIILDSNRYKFKIVYVTVS